MDYGPKIDAAINAHTQWFLRLKGAIERGSSEFEPDIVKTDNNCEFGKWLYGDFPPQLKDTPIYNEIRERHARFHRQAAEILTLALNQEREEALKMLDPFSEFKRSSLALIARMTELKKLV
jgi:chemoreceptor zinc-binding protein